MLGASEWRVSGWVVRVEAAQAGHLDLSNLKKKRK